jgi:hypothetical protein
MLGILDQLEENHFEGMPKGGLAWVLENGREHIIE